MINTCLDTDGMDEVLAQVRDVLEEECLVAHANVVEEDEMLVELSHVSHMRDDGDAELSGEQTDRQELRDSRDADGIHLDEAGTAGL